MGIASYKVRIVFLLKGWMREKHSCVFPGGPIGGSGALSVSGGGEGVESGADVEGIAGCWRVDSRFFCSWLRWPLAVARNGVRSDSLIKSIPGQERRKPSLMALWKVEIAGLPQA